MSTSDDRSDLAGYRQQVRAWLSANMSIRDGGDDSDPSAERIAMMRQLQAKLHAGGYAGFTFSAALGGQGLSLAHEEVFLEEAAPYQLPNQVFGVSVNILGGTVAEFGSEAQKLTHLPRILSGDEIWLQLLSEPSGGSDLAGLLTSATRDGDTFVVNGQKTWSSGAHHADFALCPVRTTWDVPKHQGISVLIIDLKAPGIEVRRIKKITGKAEFCEVFLTDVIVPEANLLGGENEGWAVLKGLLEIEHAWVGRVGGRGDLFDVLDGLVEQAHERDLLDDPFVRRDLVDLLVQVSAQKELARRYAEGTAAGLLPDNYGSLLKLGDSPLRQRLAERGLSLGGGTGVAWSRGSSPSRYADAYLDSRSATIAGGTTEIQRNNVSERILGLPREPAPFSGIAFNDVPHN